MKLLLPVAILLFAFAIPAVSQITITQADMPQGGDTIRLSMTADSAGLPTPALTGAGTVWDYSALISASQSIDTFLKVSSTPIAYQLYFNDPFLYKNYVATVAQAGANLPALGPITVTNMINYYKDQSANYESVGYGAEVDALPLSVKDDTIDVIYNFPMNYSNADSCHSSSHASVPSLGYYSQKQYRINHVEGWGKLITPYGTFSTLKVKTILYSSDSVYLDTLHIGFKTPKTEQIQYKWLANGQHLPVLQINETVGSRARQYIYRDSARKSPLGIADVNSPLNNVALYPNPSNGQFTLSLSHPELVSGTQTIEIYNVLGARVYNAMLKQAQQLDLSSQPNGIYFYRVLTNSGELFGEGKLVVEK